MAKHARAMEKNVLSCFVPSRASAERTARKSERKQLSSEIPVTYKNLNQVEIEEQRGG